MLFQVIQQLTYQAEKCATVHQTIGISDNVHVATCIIVHTIDTIIVEH